MTNLETLFTEQDFKLLNEALEAYPQKEMRQSLFGELFLGVLSDPKTEEEKAKAKKRRQERFKEAKEECDKKKELCEELKFKIFQLKKYFNKSKEVNEQQNDGLARAYCDFELSNRNKKY